MSVVLDTRCSSEFGKLAAIELARRGDQGAGMPRPRGRSPIPR
jgi:hypothetical protein